MKRAYFAGGCFWCITPVFAETDGVQRVISGYCGGSEENPTYEMVKHQQTGHRETICIEYDEEKTGYGALLDLFLNSVDPFDEGGQYIDRGYSYTLAVYWETETEHAAALEALTRLERNAGRAPCVRVEPYRMFWPAEEYHQDYYRKNPEAFEEELIASGRKKKETAENS